VAGMADALLRRARAVMTQHERGRKWAKRSRGERAGAIVAQKGAGGRGQATWSGFSAYMRVGQRWFAGRTKLIGWPDDTERGKCVWGERFNAE
jgi:hypothetical protein